MRRPGRICGEGVLARDGREQGVEVQRGRAAGVAEVGGPLALGAIGGELDAVAVRVGQVDRLVGAVVGGALDRGLGDREADRGAGEFLAGGVEQRVVVEAGVAPRWAGLRVLDELENNELAVAERGGRALVGVHAQAEGGLVPGDGAVEVGDGQGDGAQRERRGEHWSRGRSHVLGSPWERRFPMAIPRRYMDISVDTLPQPLQVVLLEDASFGSDAPQGRA